MNAIYKSAEGERAVRDRYLRFLDHWPVPNERLRVPTREGETFVIASGPKDAPALVLLHGSGFNSVSWMGDVTAWAAQFRVYAVDVIGQAGLSAPSRPLYGTDAYALWLDDVLDALSIERASFAGISLGGWLALDYGIRRPARVASLVLLAPGGVGGSKTSTLKLLLVIVPLLSMGDWGRTRALRMILGSSPDESAPGAKAVAEFTRLIFKHFRPNMAAPARFDDEALARLVMPVLLIVGGRDAMVDADETRARLERNVADIEVRYLADKGHMLVGETQPILEFLCRRLVA